MMNISVYITSYNQKHYLVEAIESVLNQTLKPLEIIIVDDASIDGSREMIAGYASLYPDLIRPIYHERNQGVSQTRIDALRMISGDYVTYVDGDDRFLPTKLEKEACILDEDPDTKIIFSNYYYINADGDRTGVWVDGELPPQGEVFCEVFARDYPGRSLFRNEMVDYRAWQNIGFHDPQLRLFEDYEMRIRLTKRLKTAYIDEPLAEYRRHGEGLSSLAQVQKLETLKYIYLKNKALLDELDDTKRRYVKEKLGNWLAKKGRKIAHDVLLEGKIKLGLNYVMDSLRLDTRGTFRWLYVQMLKWVFQRFGIRLS